MIAFYVLNYHRNLYGFVLIIVQRMSIRNLRCWWNRRWTCGEAACVNHPMYAFYSRTQWICIYNQFPSSHQFVVENDESRPPRPTTFDHFIVFDFSNEMTEETDNLLIALAQRCGGIESMFDSIFSFLKRKTDFYHIQLPGDKIGKNKKWL